MSAEEEARPKSETGRESEEVRDVVVEQREGGEEKGVLEVRRRGRRGRRPKAKEEMPTTTAPPTEHVHVPDVQQVISMLTRYERVLDRIEDRLRPIKRIEKESSTIKVLKRQIRDLTKHVSRLEKSVNRLKATGKGRGRGRKAKAKR